MAYEPLHHKYRPQTFAELVGQEAIATTLVNALKQQKIAPAYLFTGARGTGKTSSARILAKSLNCLKSDRPTEKPCGVCEVCRSIADGSALDVIEIDAASNTGVDNIRELIERSQFAPVQCRYKVYVVDECHMLSTAAFNALLKTLEEPPDRVIFVLATTDPQRVLPTIISRCQRFDFRRIDLPAMVRHLTQIAQAEAIDITPESVQLVAQIAQGGLRDAESMLDQLSLLEGTISVERVWDLVGAVPERDLLALVQALMQAEPTAVIDRVRHLLDRGREPLIVLQNLASFYRDLLIAKTTPDRPDLVALTAPTWQAMVELSRSIEVATLLQGQQHLRASEVQIKNTTQPRLWLEVTLMGLLPTAIAASSAAQKLPVGPSVGPAVRPTVGPAGRSLPVTPQITPASEPAGSPQRSNRPAADRLAAADSQGTSSDRSTLPSPEAPAEFVTPVDRADEQPEQVDEMDLPKVAAADPVASAKSDPAIPENQGITALKLDDANPLDNLSDAAEPNAAPEIPSATTLPAPPVAIDLEQVWQTVLGYIHPPGTQALFKQQGRLLALESHAVRVGITSQPLFKMAQQRITNLEAAFTEYMQQPMKVSLEVTAIEAPAAPDISSAYLPVDRPPETSRPGLGSRNAPTVTPPTPNGNHAKSTPTGPVPSEATAAPMEPAPSVAASPLNTAPNSGRLNGANLAPEPLPAIDASPVWQAEDEVSRAAKSLAQMFNGQVVSWEEPTALASPAATEFDRVASDLNSGLAEDGDPDDDVPF